MDADTFAKYFARSSLKDDDKEKFLLDEFNFIKDSFKLNVRVNEFYRRSESELTIQGFDLLGIHTSVYVFKKGNLEIKLSRLEKLLTLLGFVDIYRDKYCKVNKLFIKLDLLQSITPKVVRTSLDVDLELTIKLKHGDEALLYYRSDDFKAEYLENLKKIPQFSWSDEIELELELLKI